MAGSPSLHESGKWVGRILHLAAAAEQEAAKALQQRDFFKHSAEETKRVSGGTARCCRSRSSRRRRRGRSRAVAESKAFLCGALRPRGVEPKRQPEDQPD